MRQKEITSYAARAIGILSAIAMLAPCAVYAQASASASSPTPTAVTLSYQNAPVQDVLQSLFKQIGQPYVVDPAVNGHVSVTVENVSPNTALKTVLAANDTPLAFDHTGSYHIFVAPPAAASVSASSPAADTKTASLPPAAAGKQWYKVSLNKYDAGFMGSLFGTRGTTTVVPPNMVTSAGSASASGAGGAGAGAGNGGRGGGGGGGRGGGRRRGGG